MGLGAGKDGKLAGFIEMNVSFPCWSRGGRPTTAITYFAVKLRIDPSRDSRLIS